ncbi:hypothetical protein HZS_4629 [Henneguya salminicola]|nr:hypothetical protein HZS_4629 [Henneguya salminicola]
MNFGAEIEELFGSRNFYEILGIPKNSTVDEIKKAYKKMALKVHPDRVTQDRVKEANKKFQALSRISNTLIDCDKRIIYDKRGLTEDALEGFDENKDWYNYWKEVFPTINKQDILNFEQKYRNSIEEQNDIEKSYISHKGDLLKVIDDIMCAGIDDLDRIKKIINNLIENKSVPTYRAFNKNMDAKIKAAQRKFKKEAEEAEKITNNSQDLSQQIMLNQKARLNKFNHMINEIEVKYTIKKKLGKSKRRN